MKTSRKTVVALFALILLLAPLWSDADNKTNLYKKARLFTEILYKLEQNYVEELDVEELIDSAIEGMMEQTDPHTVYFKPDEFERFNSNTQGEFGGLGITIDKKGDYITVVSPIEGTPAYRLGIRTGDKIVRVDGEDVTGWKSDEVINRMRGDKGTKVLIGIRRPGVKEELEFEVIRDIIHVDSIPYAFMLDDGIGYIRMRQFSRTVAADFRRELDRLEKAGMRGLLIDLRYNPGGLLDQAVDTVNEFVGKGKQVVFTKGQSLAATTSYVTRFNHMRSGYPIVVLINEASASASEIFAGSMQDYDKALVVGKNSFGKGSVQRLFPLSDGNGIKITTAKYYINSGRCIHKEVNDKVLKGKTVSEEEQERIKAENHEHRYFTEAGRTVYGGGGITPDLMIEQEKLPALAIKLQQKNSIFDFAVEYMIDHADDVQEDFRADDALVDKFLASLPEDVDYTPAELDSSKTYIQTTLTATIVRAKFGDVPSYKITMEQDVQLQEALSLFQRFNSLDEMFAYAATQQSREDDDGQTHAANADKKRDEGGTR
jgi:carboxyl-terminal processing protease